MQDTLPVAVIGVGGFGRPTLEALRASELVHVVALGDHNRRVAESAGQEFGVRAFDDNRQLILETKPRAVYLAVPPPAAPELIAICADQGIHVWKELPLARNLAEAVAMVRRMSTAGLKFSVGTQWRFRTSYRRAVEVRPRLGQIFLARAHYLFNWGSALGWRGDKGSAGGGALLELGYHAVDLLTWLLGLPEEIFCRCAGGNRPRAAGNRDERVPPHDTDDTAATMLQYADECIASIVTTRSSGPVSEALSLHGRDGSLEAGSQQCVLRDPDGNVLNQVTDESPPRELFHRQAEAFARAVATEAGKYPCSAWENLLNMAVIEAMYLSDRTCQPENPGRLLQTHAITLEQCLAHRPLEDESS